jgi:hypothetical protein
VLLGQTRRMIKDEKIRGLAVEFGGNWLDFRRFEEHSAVDRERFPSFTPELRQAMFEEPVRFWSMGCRTTGSVLELVRRGPHVRQSVSGAALWHYPSRQSVGQRLGANRARERVRPRRRAPNGRLSDEELAGLANQPREARLLGRSPLAR